MVCYNRTEKQTFGHDPGLVSKLRSLFETFEVEMP
jgi:hypothetical protein